MKQIFRLLFLLALSLSGATSANAQSNLSDLLKGLGGSSDSSSSSSIGDVISGVANALGIGSKDITIESLAGTWSYTAPAVTFKSENLLLKAGGAAAAKTIEDKLAPYYKTAGLNKLVLTINADSTFTFKTRLTKLRGTIERSSSGDTFIFTFKALNAINIGSMETYIVKNGEKMDLTFDVSKLMTLIEKVSVLSGRSSLKTLSAMLNQYDGLTAGFSLKRTAKASDSAK